MPYDNDALVPLVVNSGFTLWLYRTADARATALAAGYFAPAAARLAGGDVMLLQAADALTLTTIRPGTELAAGVVVDSFAVPFRADRAAAQLFSVRTAASAVAMTVALVPPGGGYIAGGPLVAQASVAGPVTQIAFSVSDAVGTVVAGPLIATVSGGIATATLTAPAAGSAYRLRAEAVGFPLAADTSSPFAVSDPFALLSQDGFALLIQDGARILV